MYNIKKKPATSGVGVAAEGSGSSQFRVSRVTIPWDLTWQSSHSRRGEGRHLSDMTVIPLPTRRRPAPFWHDSHPTPDEAKAGTFLTWQSSHSRRGEGRRLSDMTVIPLPTRRRPAPFWHDSHPTPDEAKAGTFLTWQSSHSRRGEGRHLSDMTVIPLPTRRRPAPFWHDSHPTPDEAKAGTFLTWQSSHSRRGEGRHLSDMRLSDMTVIPLPTRRRPAPFWHDSHPTPDEAKASRRGEGRHLSDMTVIPLPTRQRPAPFWHDSHPTPDEAKAGTFLTWQSSHSRRGEGRHLSDMTDIPLPTRRRPAPFWRWWFVPTSPWWDMLVPGKLTILEINISHLGKLGKKSSSNMPFLGGYVNSLEGITLITLGEKQKKQHPLRSLYQAISPQPFFAQDKSWWSFCPIHDNAVGSSPPTHLKNMHKSNFIHLPTKTKVKIQNILRKSPAKKWRENLRLTASGNHVFFVPHELPNFQEIDVSLRVVV